MPKGLFPPELRWDSDSLR